MNLSPVLTGRHYWAIIVSDDRCGPVPHVPVMKKKAIKSCLFAKRVFDAGYKRNGGIFGEIVTGIGTIKHEYLAYRIM